MSKGAHEFMVGQEAGVPLSAIPRMANGVEWII
jgi:hypothetical protein